MLEQFLSNILYTAFHILSVLTLVVIFKLLKEINSLVISFIAFSMLHPNLTLLKQSMSSTTIKLVIGGGTQMSAFFNTSQQFQGAAESEKHRSMLGTSKCPHLLLERRTSLLVY